ncbi:LAMI_0F03708g1_1 [Lachancea mirantina]|uniref:Cell division control protein 31 n=1 Tax=Lachancea mirantina TaxID=1230905 RepID=A0A1G4JXD3_9SACH|nr:LAMI_0F03708g1_1 [Lachancea mirantina]
MSNRRTTLKAPGNGAGLFKTSNADNTVLQKELLEENKQEIFEAFSLFDMNNDGYLDYHEFKVAAKALGFDLSKTELLDLIDKYDRDGRRLMHYDDFFLIMGERILNRDPLDEIRRAFKLFDDDNTGKISLKNLRRVAKELGENLTDEELRAMIDEFDLDNDGEINEREFIAICTDS